MTLITQIRVRECLLFLILQPFWVYGQGFSLGLNNPKNKWYQLNSPAGRVIFQSQHQYAGGRVLRILDYMRDSLHSNDFEKADDIDIIIHPQSITPNGFVTVLPFHSQFYSNPPQRTIGSGNVHWLDLLAIHEYRHVQQYLNARRGVTKLASIFGSSNWGLMSATALPNWYFEGDAVVSETLLTSGGRGRNPSFNKDYKSLVQTGRVYNYEKARFGSYKDFVPSHYPLGYYMTSYIRKNFGDSIWNSAVREAVRYKKLIYPFSRSLKDNTGFTTSGIYREMIKDLGVWYKDTTIQPINPSQSISKKHKYYTSYQNAVLTKNGIYAVKTSFKEIPRIYHIDTLGEERRITTIGNISWYNRNLSYRKGKLIWLENVPHIRWGNDQYTRLMFWDEETKTKKVVLKRGKYLAPDLSYSGDKIAIVDITNSNEHKLIVFNFLNEVVWVKDTFSMSNMSSMSRAASISFPRWTEDDKYIICVLQTYDEHTLLRINAETGKQEKLFVSKSFDIGQPFPRGKYVYFRYGHGGTDDIHVLDTESKQLYQVHASRFGAYQPYADVENKELLISTFSPLGYALEKVQIDTTAWKKVEDLDKPLPYYAESIPTPNHLNVPNRVSAIENTYENTYEQKKFNTKSKLITPVGFYTSVENIINNVYNLSVSSLNAFRTMSASASASYNADTEASNYRLNMLYGEYFTVLGLQAASGSIGRYYKLVKKDSIYVSELKSWAENRISASAILPFNLSRGSFMRNLSLIAQLSYLDTKYDSAEYDSPDLGAFNALAYRLGLSWSNTQISARRQIGSRWAQSVWMYWDNMFEFGLNNFYAGTRVHFPGLFKTHSFSVQGDIQLRDPYANYGFADYMRYARGHTQAGVYDNATMLAFDYNMPLIYPDFSMRDVFKKSTNFNLGSLFYLQRIRSRYFFDYATHRIDGFRDRNFWSTGASIIFDVRVLRLVQLAFELRYTYAPNHLTGNVHQLTPHVLGISF